MRRLATLFVTLALTAPLADARAANPLPDASAPAEPTASVAARATLEMLVGQLVSADRNMRRAASRSIDTLGPTATSAMTGELARLRPGRPAVEIVALLSTVHVTPAASDASAEGSDRLGLLLDTPPKNAGAAYAQAVTTLCLVRALAHVATPDAVAGLAPVALDARGAFAPEVQQTLATLGERATAGLVLMSHSRSPQAAKWASSELETLGKRTPGDAVQTKSKEVLADVLLAYGATADADAVSVVMSFVNADRRLVRDAAREALARYGDLAVPKLREAYGLLVGEASPMDWPPAWLRKKLFDALDRVRLEDVDTRVRAGLALAQEGRFQDAVADFDDVLARQPDWDRKGELVPAYVFYAQSLLDSDPKRARDLFEKARRLDPGGPRAPQVGSSLALLEGRELAARGIDEEEPFRRALALDPGNVAAAAEIERIDEEGRSRKKIWERRLLGGGVLALVSVLILFVGGGRRRAR